MGWRENLKPGSFKGVPVSVVGSVSVVVGRKLQDASSSGSLFSNPLGTDAKKKDKPPGFKDNGPLAREYTAEFAFVGDDYQVHRDNFIAAVETAGAGKLVLPTHPVIERALARTATVNFTNQEGGRETCTVSFVVEGETVAPKKASATKAETQQSAASSLVSGAQNLTDNYAVPQTDFSFGQVTIDLQHFVDALRDWLSAGEASDTETFDETNELIDQVEADKEVIATSSTLMNNSYFDTLNEMSKAFTTPESAFSAMIGIAATYAGKIQEVTGTGAQAIQRAKNRVASLIAIQNACLANAALILSSLDFASIEDATLIRETFGTSVRTLQATIGAESGFAETYRDLVRLNSAVFNDLVDRSAALPVLETRTVATDRGGVQYAYHKYGDADRLSEILERNDIRRSLFLSGDLEVLSR